MAHGPYILLPLVAAVLISIYLIYVSLTKSRLKVRKVYVVLLLEMGLLALSTAAEMTATTLSGKASWNIVEYLANVMLPSSFLLFSLIFMGRNPLTNVPFMLSLLAVPAMTMMLLLTNDYHHLFYSSMSLDRTAAYSTFEAQYGIGFWIHSAWSVMVYLSGIGILAHMYLRSTGLHRRRFGLAMASAMVPIASLVLYVSGLTSVSLTYLFSMGTLVSCATMYFGMFRYEQSDTVPLALEGIMGLIDDVIIIVDNDHRILFANQNLLDMMNTKESRLYGHEATYISDTMTRGNIEAIEAGGSRELYMNIAGESRTYNIRVKAIHDLEGDRMATLLILRDFTEEKKVRDSLQAANVKLSLLSRVVRHDTLNQVTLIHSYSDLMNRPLEDRVQKHYAERIRDAVKSIESQLEFSKAYDSMGTQPPRWQNADEVFREAWAMGLAAGLQKKTDLEDLELLADTLLVRAFGLLMDNTKQHGVGATTIEMRYERHGDSLIVIYEDDGCGIKPEEKPLIFNQGYGKHNGLGLFLAKQVLEMSGMSVRECGAPGVGARFEITVPAGGWRLKPRQIKRIATRPLDAPRPAGSGRRPVLPPRGEARRVVRK